MRPATDGSGRWWGRRRRPSRPCRIGIVAYRHTNRNADGLVASPPFHIARVRPRCAHQPILSPAMHHHGAIPLRHPGRQATTIRWNVTAGKVPTPRPGRSRLPPTKFKHSTTPHTARMACAGRIAPVGATVRRNSATYNIAGFNRRPLVAVLRPYYRHTRVCDEDHQGYVPEQKRSRLRLPAQRSTVP
ncbi:MAG: hypothetical protein KatS3mg055_1977 [Chloroflexus sp.]|nr:MAG: hypothetical protein KatS3mg055_1977 [Chloroflexus sp.]